MFTLRVFVRQFEWKFEVGKIFHLNREKAGTAAACVEKAYKVSGGSDRWKLCKSHFSTLESMLSLKEMYFRAFQRNPGWWMALNRFHSTARNLRIHLEWLFNFFLPSSPTPNKLWTRRASIQGTERDLGILFFPFQRINWQRKSSELENRFCKLFPLS